MRHLFANLCLLLVAGVVGVVLCEGSLRLLYPKYQHLAETQFRRDEMRIWTYRPNSRHVRNHPDTVLPHSVHHNNLALRQHRDFSEAALASATNIGVFGDSFVENFGMAAPYSFTEPLDYLLNRGQQRFNVLNFGVDGYGPGQSLLSYQDFRYVDDLDHVLFVYCENDLRNIYETGLFHLNEAGRLERHAAIRPPWWIALISRLHVSYLVLDASGRLSSSIRAQASIHQKMRNEYERMTLEQRGVAEHAQPSLETYRGAMDDTDYQNSLAIFQQMMGHWKRLVEANGGAFSVVVLPNLPPNPDIVDRLEKEHIEVHNLYSCFRRHDPTFHDRLWYQSPYRFKNDGHWNEAGNRMAAVCLYRFLEEKMGLPPLSAARLQDALSEYYAAFEGEVPLNTWGGGQKDRGSSEMSAEIREKYLALDLIRLRLKEKTVELMAQPDKRIISSFFDVYLEGDSLIYLKEDCRPADMQAWFFLHIRPTGVEHLPLSRIQYGFDNLDFPYLDSRSKIDDTTCTIRRRLPDYPIRHIRTGQFVRDAQGNFVHLWEGEFFVGRGAGVEGAGLELRRAQG